MRCTSGSGCTGLLHRRGSGIRDPVLRVPVRPLRCLLPSLRDGGKGGWESGGIAALNRRLPACHTSGVAREGMAPTCSVAARAESTGLEKKLCREHCREDRGTEQEPARTGCRSRGRGIRFDPSAGLRARPRFATRFATKFATRVWELGRRGGGIERASRIQLNGVSL